MSKEERIAELEAQLVTSQVWLTEARNAADSLQTQLDEATTKRDDYRVQVVQLNADLIHQRDRVIRAVVQYGEENGSCIDGMVDFVAEAFDMTRQEAESLVKSLVSQQITVTITATVFGAEYYSITDDEATDFLVSVLNADSVDCGNVYVEMDD